MLLDYKPRTLSASSVEHPRLPSLIKTNRTEEMREEARLFLSEVLHLPYKEGLEGLLQMAQAGFSFPPAKERRRRVHAETVE